MTIRKPLKALSTDNNIDRLGEFGDIDTLSSFTFSNDPTGKTYTTGTNISATFDNIDTSMTSVAGIVNPNRICFSAYRSLPIVWEAHYSSGDYGPEENFIIFDTQVFDTASAYDTVTGIFTAPVAGLYYFQAQHSMNDFIASQFYERMRIYKNNVADKYLYNVTAPYGDFTGTGQYAPITRNGHGNTMIHLNTNDEIKIKVSLDCYFMTEKNTRPGREYTFFQGYLAVKD